MSLVRAPGKLMVAGEYAVLDGAPAVVLAVDRGVQCSITPADELQIDTPDGDDRFVRPALEGCSGHFSFSAWNPTDLPEKPGFGGSAAACVAACVAAGRPAADAIAIHHQVQGGGSGADVLASIHGGMIRVHDGDARPLTPIRPVVIWSGKSAKTQPRVDHYLSIADRSAFVHASTQIVDHFSDDPVRMLGENADLLMHLGETGLPYMTPSLAVIRSLARLVVAQPSPLGRAVETAPSSPPEAESAFKIRARDRDLIIIDVNVAGPVG